MQKKTTTKTPKKPTPKIQVLKAPAKGPGKKAPAKKAPARKTKPKGITLTELDRRERRADLDWKEERVLMMKIKRGKLEGELISQNAAAEKAGELIADIQGQVLQAISGIAKAKFDQVKKIFNKYLS